MSTASLLQLLHITDSSFPVGSYAYSHGLEWLVSTGRVRGESDLALHLPGFVGQVLQRQWLPAAALAHRATSGKMVALVDERFDASLTAAAERAAGRAMGDRLAKSVAMAQASDVPMEWAGPHQYAVVFGVAARGYGVSPAECLSALGFSTLNSLIQAALRLGVIGPDAAVRLVAGASGGLARAVEAVAAQRRPRIGSFAPAFEVASMLQPTLRFRMFAS